MLLISDTNIIIDLDVGGVLEQMFRLQEDFAVPNILYLEELSEQHSELPALGLKILDIKEEFMRKAYELGGIYNKPGRNDIFALVLALQEKCTLLSGDSDLREAATSENVEVRGTLWVMERLFEEKLLDLASMEAAYVRMKKESRRLPWNQIDAQLEKYEKQKSCLIEIV